MARLPNPWAFNPNGALGTPASIQAASQAVARDIALEYRGNDTRELLELIREGVEDHLRTYGPVTVSFDVSVSWTGKQTLETVLLTVQVQAAPGTTEAINSQVLLDPGWPTPDVMDELDGEADWDGWLFDGD